MTYAPENCPSKHHNPGNDICSDCGQDLNPPLYVEADQEITALQAAQRMARYSLRLHEAVLGMLGAYELRPALNEEQPESTAQALAASLDEWMEATLRYSHDWAVIAQREEAAERLRLALEKEATNPDPETRRVVVLSTAHLTAETCAMLTATPVADWPVAGGPLPWGFYIYVHDGEGEVDEKATPADLIACFDWARDRFDYIQFDSDAPARPDIPSHEH